MRLKIGIVILEWDQGRCDAETYAEFLIPVSWDGRVIVALQVQHKTMFTENRRQQSYRRLQKVLADQCAQYLMILHAAVAFLHVIKLFRWTIRTMETLRMVGAFASMC